MNRFVKSLLLSIATIVVCSCGTSKLVPLSGEWTIEEVNGKSAVGEMTPFIGFNQQDSTIYGSNSCNRFFGGIVYDEKSSSAISFSNVGSTKMLCANSPMESEIEMAINIVAAFSYTPQGDAQLLDKDNVVVLLLTPKTED